MCAHQDVGPRYSERNTLGESLATRSNPMGTCNGAFLTPSIGESGVRVLELARLGRRASRLPHHPLAFSHSAEKWCLLKQELDPVMQGEAPQLVGLARLRQARYAS